MIGSKTFEPLPDSRLVIADEATVKSGLTNEDI